MMNLKTETEGAYLPECYRPNGRHGQASARLEPQKACDQICNDFTVIQSLEIDRYGRV